MPYAQLEVCAYSIESCRAAESGGANRIELCASPYEGGITPSAGLLTLAKKYTRLPICVMLRPRGGDFYYSDTEFEQMQADLAVIRQLGADGVVLGLLKPDGTVDIPRTARLVKLAHPLPVTFHRAFDMTVNYAQAIEAVIGTGCQRLLTSGGHPTAYEGRVTLSQLVQLAQGCIEVIAGSGINASNAHEVLHTGVDALHMTGKSTRISAMTFRRPELSMGGHAAFSEYEIIFSDELKIRAVVDVMQRQAQQKRKH
ncbi:MAG: copper homeostasis protein CutC [Cytophagaceae bacterium]|nr:copper homeostasis protein CutC [Cytophagaceae bacterium]